MSHPQFPPLRRVDLSSSPFEQFERWMAEAQRTSLIYPNAMAVATADADANPSVRYVLLREYGENGFYFYTNYNSQKGKELQANPRAALLFYWDVLGRQVRVSGRVEIADKSFSDRYFAQRPRASRISAWTSPQSNVVAHRDVLEDRYDELEREFAGKEVSRPEHWGGFRVIPEEIEFWQHQDDRLHDRFRYRKDEHGSWAIERLAP